MTNPLTAHEENPAKSQLYLIPFIPNTIRQTFVVLNRQGLHCRPAAMLILSLRDFDCEVTVECNGGTANGRSIFDLMSLAAGCGSKLAFKMTGPDAAAALAAIQHVFETNFAGAYAENNRFTQHNFS
jgi:phosphotransferase system HPr (HPr) family protein